jgi:phytoene synthase
MDAFHYCEALVRAADKVRFLSSLFAAPEQRKALFALYAFNVEITRVSELIREPLAGEIRLQWWSDLLAAGAQGEAEANPVAAALVAAKTQYNLPADELQIMIEARRFDLYDEPMQSIDQLEQYAKSVSSTLIALAASVLIGRGDGTMSAMTDHAGIAYAIVGLLKAFPIHARRRQIYLPLEIIERHGSTVSEIIDRSATSGLRAALAELRVLARAHLHEAGRLLPAVPAAAIPALLPVAVVAPTLARMEHRSYDPFVEIDIPSWRRQWLIWRAARKPDRIFSA